ncbi:MAG: trimethylamine methyltransferase family protein [Actinobacteria bacterium]|nr:trimethylamine methyltransferase family protein [Actinomycetota bacterium]
MKLNQTEVLSIEEVKKIDETSKEVLEEEGIKIFSKDALDIYKKSGCEVDYNNNIVKIPYRLVEKCIKSSPSEFKLYGRDKDNYLDFGKNLGYSASGHNAIYILDTETMERRLSTKEEIGNFAKISDALDNIHIVGVEAMPQDVYPKASILHAIDAVVNNTSKHIFYSPENADEAKASLEMLKAVNDGESLQKTPIGICQLSPISPLTWSKGTIEGVMEVAKTGLPLCFLPQPYCGVTSPITLAGTLVTNNAETLSGLVLAQLLNEGAPMIYGAAWTTFEMNKGAVLIGTPERCLLSIGGAQIARYYGIPSHCIAFDTDSNIYDEQNGFEKIFNIIATLQSGINLIVNAGMFSTGMTVSYEQLIVDAEMAGFVYRYLKGIEVNADTLSRDVIKRVGQHENYMMEPHTMKYLKLGEHASYRVSNRDVYDNWKSKGKPSITDNARKLALEIIRDHKPRPLTEVKQRKLKEIITGFEARFK